jgi:hypothetical protein
VAQALPSRSWVELVSRIGKRKYLVAPSTRLARLTVWPSGPYLNFEPLPVLPTRAAPVFRSGVVLELAMLLPVADDDQQHDRSLDG